MAGGKSCPIHRTGEMLYYRCLGIQREERHFLGKEVDGILGKVRKEGDLGAGLGINEAESGVRSRLRGRVL